MSEVSLAGIYKNCNFSWKEDKERDIGNRQLLAPKISALTFQGAIEFLFTTLQIKGQLLASFSESN